jgi:hypothetical protein
VAQLGENSSAYRVVVGKLKETGGLKDQVLGKERIPLNGSCRQRIGCGMNSSASE